MERAYAQKINNINDFYNEKHILCKNIDFIHISNNPWNLEYVPDSYASVGVTDNSIIIYLRSYEESIRATYENRNDPVCNDSCLEFFIAPTPSSTLAYFNFEINPLGTLYTGFSKTGKRADSKNGFADFDKDYFKVISNNDIETNGFWDVCFEIPFEYFGEYLPEKEVRANFYKCGDLTDNIHYLTWNNIETEKPDFHVPEFFGSLIL